MAEPFEEFLAHVRNEETLVGKNEEVVRQAVVLPILEHLGWNKENCEEVYPEFTIEGKRVDYCLKLQGRPRVLIEVKRAGEPLDRHQKQLLDYSFGHGAPLAALTNGTEWWLYLPLREGPWEERKFFVVDISEQEPSSAARHLKEFLSKVAVSDGSSADRASKVLDDNVRLQKTSEVLPRVWGELLEQADDLPDGFFEPIYQRVESACGYRATRDQVVKYLQQARNTVTAWQPSSRPAEPSERSKTDRVREILKDHQWHSAPELREKLSTSSINPVLHRLEEEGVVEFNPSRRGNRVRLKSA